MVLAGSGVYRDIDHIKNPKGRFFCDPGLNGQLSIKCKKTFPPVNFSPKKANDYYFLLPLFLGFALIKTKENAAKSSTT